MKQVSHKIMCAVFGLGLGFSVTSANAFLAYDVVRTVEFAVQGVERMMSLISEYQKVQSKQEELKSWENRKTMKEEDLLTSNVYTKLKKSISEGDSQKYYPAQDNAEDAEKYIKEYFFLPSDSKQFTQEMKKEIEQRRYAYVEALAKEVLSLSEGVRQSARSSLNALKEADTVAGSNIQQVDLLIQTKKTMAEQKAADIMLHSKLLELEAAKMLLHMDLQYQENPEKNK